MGMGVCCLKCCCCCGGGGWSCFLALDGSDGDGNPNSSVAIMPSADEAATDDDVP